MKVREQTAARPFTLTFPRTLGISNATAVNHIQISHMIDLISSNEIGAVAKAPELLLHGLGEYCTKN